MNHRTRKKKITAENLTRSAEAPMISADFGVMRAKVIWKATKTISGMEPDSESGAIPASMTLSSVPMNGDRAVASPGMVKAIE